MTPGANISLFVVNLLWISVFAFAFVLNFISQRVNIEKREADQLKELDVAKTKLYTNITHEFRTPLTVIQGMADIIRDKSDEKLREETEIIERNGNTLLHLVNQMLDLSKLETNAMPVHMIQADIIYYIRYLVNSFRSLADIKNITFQFRLSPDQFVMDYDPDKLMQIMSNLISNAFKFTPAGGKVEIFSRVTGTEKQTVELRIKDNGEGIPEDHIPHIFDRFYRVETRFRPATRGSGLGLALTRELVKMFKGTINVSSVYGKGTEFIVCLPVTRDAALEEISDYLTIEKKIPTAMLLHEEKKTVEPVEEVVSEDKPLLLVVEDSHDVVLYLHTILRGDYNVQVAYDGRKGLQKALELMPDIILTDIMMPEMDGIELLDKIKNDIRTSHIPVVVLTAKADLASRLTGLERGADVYIAKPFNKRELLVQLNKLIKLRKKLQERYAVMGNITISRDKAYKTEDSFMQKIRDIMFVNLEDGTFDIQKLCQHLAISRAQLYRKFKFLTNKTIADYFRSLRLHKARELLLTSGANVSDAAYQTGFKNLSHFSKVFTKEFGINPSEIQK
jgi:CheY-like chemotaxis protein/nitrogen-specific signal transduction histidine kinase/AraC-like DNA-binding protein